MIAEIFEVGGEINKVEVYEFEPGNNGVVATEDISIGELICFIPLEVLITLEMAEKSPIVKFLYE